MRLLSRFTILLAFLNAAGCFSYTSADPSTVPTGSAVRARITAAEAERLVSVLGREDRVLEGLLVGREPEGIRLEVASVVGTRGASVMRLKQGVTLPPTELNELEVRRLDGFRTAGLVAGAVVITAALISAAFAVESGSPVSGPGKGGVEMSVGRILLRSQLGR